MVEHAINKLLSLYRYTKKYREVELKVSIITSDWLSSERDSMKCLP